MNQTSYDLSTIFDEHVGKEFLAKDVAATMATMVAEPNVNQLLHRALAGRHRDRVLAERGANRATGPACLSWW